MSQVQKARSLQVRLPSCQLISTDQKLTTVNCLRELCYQWNYKPSLQMLVTIWSLKDPQPPRVYLLELGCANWCSPPKRQTPLHCRCEKQGQEITMNFPDNKVRAHRGLWTTKLLPENKGDQKEKKTNKTRAKVQ